MNIYNVVAAPFIWSMIVPVVFADICIEIYHRICFPLFGIPYVDRSKYIRIVDRAKLPYLSWPERLGCAYCGYVNGWLHYASVIAGKTELHRRHALHGRGHTMGSLVENARSATMD